LEARRGGRAGEVSMWRVGEMVGVVVGVVGEEVLVRGWVAWGRLEMSWICRASVAS